MDKFNHQCACACGIEFKQKKNLYAHMRKQHNIEPLQKQPEKIFNYECDLCGRKFSCHSSIIRHLRRNHSNSNNKLIGVNKKVSLICPYGKCSEHFRTYEILREHLVGKHDFQVEFEELMFSSLGDFDKWKDRMEVETLSWYTQSTAARTLRIELGHRLFFNCHRSNVYRHRGNNIRAIKAQGSNKIGKTCPSRLEVTYTSYAGQIIITVKFWKTHCGHNNQVKSLPLNRRIKCLIAEKLEEGFTFEQIVDWIRASRKLYVDGVAFKKLPFLSREDIYNIIKDFKIEEAKRTTKRNRNIDFDKSNITATITNDCDSNITLTVDMKNNILLPSISGCAKVFEINGTKENLPTASGNENNIFTLSDSETRISTIVSSFSIKNEELVHKAEFLSNLAKAVSLNNQDSLYIEEEVDRLVKKAKSSISDTTNIRCDSQINEDTTKCSHPEINKCVNESLINKTQLLSNIVKTVSLGDEDSRNIANQIDALIEKVQLSNLDCKKLVQDEIQNQVFDNSETKYCKSVYLY